MGKRRARRSTTWLGFKCLGPDLIRQRNGISIGGRTKKKEGGAVGQKKDQTRGIAAHKTDTLRGIDNREKSGGE